jgi:cell division protein FtsL
MSRGLGIVERAAGVLQRLNFREKLLLFALVVIFAFMAAFGVVRSHQGKMATMREEITRYEQAIQLLAARQTELRNADDEGANIAELLRNNNIQLHSYLERACDDSQVDRPARYQDQTIPLRDRRGGQPDIDEYETTALIERVAPNPLGRLLHTLGNGPPLVLLKSIDVQTLRGSQNLYQVQLKLSTYRLAQAEEEG